MTQERIEELLETLGSFVPLLATIACVVGVLALSRSYFARRTGRDPDGQFRFQLVMLFLTFSGGLAIALALPVGDALRGQLLSLIGILLSAAIALSSTTFIGNIMAGIMLKAIRSVRPGDFVTVEDLTGRVAEMALLHTEVQTEDRDLVTVPNLWMVTHPMKVVRPSGTVVSAEVSLGYDVPRARVSDLLRSAATAAGLQDTFVQVRELGDFSVLYRVAGLLVDVESLISARSRLREEMLDALHGAGIEIVSPGFMNTRALAPDAVILAEPVAPASSGVAPEDVVFDRASRAASIEKIRSELEATAAEADALGADSVEADRRATLEARKERLAQRLARAEASRDELEDSERRGERTPSGSPDSEQG